jgi:4-carboxymuconolactone decarboxylase
MSDEEKRAKGIELVQKLFGETASDAGSFLPSTLADYTVRHVFGDPWQQDDLTVQERELATSAMLIALNREGEQRLHFTAAKNLGIERKKVEALITHAAHYAGWPCAVSAARVLQEVWPKEDGA